MGTFRRHPDQLVPHGRRFARGPKTPPQAVLACYGDDGMHTFIDNPSRLLLTLSALALASCGDDGGRTSAGTASATGGISTTAATAGTSAGTASGGTSMGSATGTSASGTAGTASGTATGGMTTGGTATGGTATGGSTTGGVTTGPKFDMGNQCTPECSIDQTQVLCDGMVQETCQDTEACDPMTLTCLDACTVAENNKLSVGCEYYAVDMQSFSSGYCFAAFVGNTSQAQAFLTVDRNGMNLPVANFTRIPQGNGPGLTYQAYDPNVGLAPGEVAILFLSGTQGQAPNCPAPPAVAGDAGFSGTGKGDAFRIGSNVPVVAYQINPYGGGSVAVTGASLLLPTSVWDTSYISVNAYRDDIGGPSMDFIAMEDNTTVTMTPVAAVAGGGGIPASGANQPFQFTLNKGDYAQITQTAELTGSVINADKPIGHLGGHPCMRTPYQVAYCDHGEQMIPPVNALGNEYVGVMYRPRGGEPAIWRVVGVVDGTQLTWSNPVGGPPTLNQGQVAEFITGDPFVVSSQDGDHPFMLFTYMSGSQWNQLANKSHGDVDFVISVPTDQYMTRYVFFSDPTYPETNLVFVRRKLGGVFHDVTLDCAGVLGNWQPIGEYEWTRVDLITGNFQDVGNCSTGPHEAYSDAPFGLWNWGWGTPLTSTFTQNVSYGYPGGMKVVPINDVILPQ